MSNTDKVVLGRVRPGLGLFAEGEVISIWKHEWQCGWYWAFGYVGNRNRHFHFDSLLYPRDSKNMVCHTYSEIFESDKPFPDGVWWVVRDLFVQAYALQKAAEVYRYGGHQTICKGVTDIICNKERAAQINADLKVVLDTVWEILTTTKRG